MKIYIPSARNYNDSWRSSTSCDSGAFPKKDAGTNPLRPRTNPLSRYSMSFDSGIFKIDSSFETQTVFGRFNAEAFIR